MAAYYNENDLYAARRPGFRVNNKIQKVLVLLFIMWSNGSSNTRAKLAMAQRKEAANTKHLEKDARGVEVMITSEENAKHDRKMAREHDSHCEYKLKQVVSLAKEVMEDMRDYADQIKDLERRQIAHKLIAKFFADQGFEPIIKSKN